MFPIPADMIGMFAAIITTLCWIPQALHLLRTRETKSISLASQTSFALGLSLWLAYGVMIESWPIILANAFTLMIIGMILALKIRYD